MSLRTPEEARAQISFALEAKRQSLAAATEALHRTPEDTDARREVDRLKEDVGRLEIRLHASEG